MQDNRQYHNFDLEVHYRNRGFLRRASSECDIPRRIQTSGRAGDEYIWGDEEAGFNSNHTHALNALVNTIPAVIEGKTNEHFPDLLDWDHEAIVADYGESYIGLHHHDDETLVVVASALLEGAVDPSERLDHETAALVSKRAWCEGILTGVREICDVIIEIEDRVRGHPRMTHLRSNLETARERFDRELATERWQE